MARFICFLNIALILAFATAAFSQEGIKINDTSSTNTNGAILDLESKNQGGLHPRLSQESSPLSSADRDTLVKVSKEVKTHLGTTAAKQLIDTKTIDDLKTLLLQFTKQCAKCVLAKTLHGSLAKGK